ncbi:Enoyl-CoA hydratase/carnithine racemase [Desulfocicer vacuolatum DSM 3385]|uniref:Enoyl-CoA hydratase/carnithine racemase n=1 Tax=Desulfocicer vacuolatum DSM 3385 TaxID=1121400 RepID=A0A1W2D6X7_9BACT|nr:crotonase/enoyl-CoA hydratase family protein [Desulfocicer vacuolatum]SMC92822.1 Enoyl-CoA hydratase/carnithine racemase [Desulfocicer vacuolatum DSM 3385]
MSKLVTIKIENHVADIRLNRAKKYNALNYEMMMAMADAIKMLSLEKKIRAVVLSGEGKGFCAGLDFASFTEMTTGEASHLKDLEKRYENTNTNLPQFITYGWKKLPMPVIAAIHGVAVGGGCQIALGADIRFCTPDAKLSLMEMKWGLIPDMAASQNLRDLIPIDVAKELYFTGKTINGEEAARLNIVTRICENPHEEAMSLAREISSNSPTAVRAAKSLLNQVWHGANEGQGLLKESQLEMTLMGKENQIEAITANFEKRTPIFKDPV